MFHLPKDAVWGIGIAAEDALNLSPEQWPGKNMLGKAIMEVGKLLKEGKTVEEVMHVRGLKESTIMGHVAVLVEKGELDAQDFVDGEILEMAMEKFAANKNMTLGDLFEELDQSVPYSLLRVAYAYFLFQTSSHSRDNTES
mgnify:CR=1 FL=1